MARIICVANPVKGVGRTLSAVNFAASLALLEKKTLIVDCDPFKQTSEYLGFTNDNYDYGLDDVLTGFVGGKGVVAESDIAYLDVIPAGHGLDDIEKNLAYNPDKEKVLNIIMKKFRADYDYIIFDTPGSNGLLTKSALIASDDLLIPLRCDRKAVDNLSTLLTIINEMREEYKSIIQLSGILFTYCDTIETAEAFFSKETLHKFEDVVFKTTIPESTFMETNLNKNQPACLIDLKSDIAESFLDVAFEFLARGM